MRLVPAAVLVICTCLLRIRPVVSDASKPNGFTVRSPSVGLSDERALQDARRSIQERITRRAGTPAGERTWLLDDLVTEKAIEVFRNYMMTSAWFSFQLTARDGVDKDAGGDGVPWGANTNVEDFMTLDIGRELGALATVFALDARDMKHDTSGSSVPVLFASEVTYKVVRRGDLTSVHHGGEDDGDDVWMMMFMNDEWESKNYGEVMIHNGQEVISVASPRYGRVLVWTPSLGYLCRPPAITFSQGESILMVKWSTNATKVEELEMQRRRDHIAIQSGITGGFPLRSAADHQAAAGVNVAEHEVLRRQAQTGKKVVAFDNLFTDDELLALRSYIISHGKVFYDDSIDGYSDNVQWISGFLVSYFVQTKYWDIIKKVVTHVSEGVGDWYPYDVSCNIIRSYDHTRIHSDVRNMIDDEWTYLLYLSPMGGDDFGETAFFTKNSDNTELVYQVRPRYGRSVIFEGLIPHAARPPSPAFKGPRYSFAVKMAKTPARALQHMLHDIFAQNENLLPSHEENLPEGGDEALKQLSKRIGDSVPEWNSTFIRFSKRAVEGREELQRALLDGTWA